jgi:hypothetical protein
LRIGLSLAEHFQFLAGGFSPGGREKTTCNKDSESSILAADQIRLEYAPAIFAYLGES